MGFAEKCREAEFCSRRRDFKEIFRSLAETFGSSCSDIHVCTGQAVIVRVNGKLQRYAPNPDFLRPLSEPEVLELCELLLAPHQMERLRQEGQADASCTCPYGLHPDMQLRCRVNAFRDRGGVSLAIRLLKQEIPSMASLRLPPAVQKLRQEPCGLVVICGPTGSGKTTTLASLLEAVNQEQEKRIITIEDPVEYAYRWKNAVISQREVGTDCRDFSAGLRAALRQDPDIILVGEMRDAETIATALAAAETGHLVFSTLHTATAAEAIDRMVQYFPAGAHGQIRTEIAACFRAIVAQRLFRTRKGGRAAAFEVLLHSDAIANLIRQNQAYQMQNYMQKELGMIRMEDSIQGLRNLRLID